MNGDSDVIKLVLLGDSGSGKSSTVETYTTGGFQSTISTVGLDVRLKKVKVNDSIYKVQIWDTAGQEKFYSITKSYFTKCQGIIIVYSTTKKESFDNVNRWIAQINMQINDNIPKVLLGNKCDLTIERQVSYEQGEELARKYGIKFFETSAKMNTNITEAFEHVINKIVNDEIKTTEEARKIPPSSTTVVIASNKPPKKQPSRCC